MRVPLPERHDESVTLLPFQIAFADFAPALTFEHMIERRRRMAVNLRRFFGLEKLDLTRHRWISIATGGRIDIAQQCAIVWISVGVAHRLKRLVGIFERIATWHSAPVGIVLFRRACKTQTVQ